MLSKLTVFLRCRIMDRLSTVVPSPVFALLSTCKNGIANTKELQISLHWFVLRFSRFISLLLTRRFHWFGNRISLIVFCLAGTWYHFGLLDCFFFTQLFWNYFDGNRFVERNWLWK